MQPGEYFCTITLGIGGIEYTYEDVVTLEKNIPRSAAYALLVERALKDALDDGDIDEDDVEDGFAILFREMALN